MILGKPRGIGEEAGLILIYAVIIVIAPNVDRYQTSIL